MKHIIFSIIIATSVVACSPSKSAKTVMTNERNLDGTWDLVFISGQNYDALYEKRKPTLIIDVKAKKINGNTGCNNYFGSLLINGRELNFPEPLGMTKMYCEGRGEEVFVNKMKEIKGYSIDDAGATLSLTNGNETLLRFSRH